MQTKSCEKEHGYWLNFFMCNLSTANTASTANKPDVLRCGVVVGLGLCSKATAAHEFHRCCVEASDIVARPQCLKLMQHHKQPQSL